MAVSRSGAKTSLRDDLKLFVWEGVDKRGTKMKCEQSSKSENLVRAALRRMALNPTSVRAKSKPLFGSAGKKVTPGDIAAFRRMLATLIKSEIDSASCGECVLQYV